MLISKTDKVALHEVSGGKYTKRILYVGSNPYGPRGGRSGGPVNAREIVSRYWPSSVPYETAKLLREHIASMTSDTMEIDVEALVCRASAIARYGLQVVQVKETPAKDLPLLLGSITEERALKLLQKRLIKGT